jgi:hypothetical protein
MVSHLSEREIDNIKYPCYRSSQSTLSNTINGDINRELTRPRGPSLGAKADAEPISPPTALSNTIFSSPGGGGAIISVDYNNYQY